MTLQLKKATKEQSLLRATFHGPSGSGKTKSALRIMIALVNTLSPGKRVRLIDTERGSASKYAGAHDFDVIEIADDYSPERLGEGIDLAVSDGECGGLIIDSLSHFWNGPGGILELVDKEARRIGQARNGRADTYAAWNLGDKFYRRTVQRLTAVPCHIITTLRAKQEYVKDDKTNKIEKRGFAPEMRTGFEYEADIEASLDIGHTMTINKTRFESLDGKEFFKPGPEVAELLASELRDGRAATPTQHQPQRTAPAPQVATPAPAAIDESEVQLIIAACAAADGEAELRNARDHATKIKRQLTGDQMNRIVEAVKDAQKRLAERTAA